ncbi:hypothetical protein [Rhodopirellula halodulae]|uniref:hypothetical protein n=1 Tax=Rhodopirellula halodulae TaxID=2894198 RepID=UPI001E35F060|nr:hypothetical protein [Rhodopirellula sp. JC737]MCC9654364.1 hypothetical protein [Rhodopirellula sp. JC737]
MTNSTARAGIDTNILIYSTRTDADIRKLIDEQARKEARKLRAASQRLLKRLRQDDWQIFISTITLGEYLVKVDPRAHAKTIIELRSLCTFAEFNIRAATLAAEMTGKAKAVKQTMRLKVDRPVLMADVKIIASLRAAGVQHFYVNDGGCCKVAQQFMKASLLPMEPVTLLEIMEQDETESD